MSTGSSRAQQYVHYRSADPIQILYLEHSNFLTGSENTFLDLRPLLLPAANSGVDAQVSSFSRYFYNDNVPNLENTGELWVGKGNTIFSSIHLDVWSKHFFFSTEPYVQYAQNKSFMSYHFDRVTKDSSDFIEYFHVLNDGPARGNGQVKELRFRETQIYGHLNGIGAGFSTANMWWGPGIHNTINMTNNTSGFPHFVLGTLREQRVRNIGLHLMYVFGQPTLTDHQPYFTAIIGASTFYSEPIITLGFVRTYLSGGSDHPGVSWGEAALKPFEAFFKESFYNGDGSGTDIENDPDDQTVDLFLTLQFPKSGLKLFIQYGWTDHRWDWFDFRAHPDHASASIIGFRKYGLFDLEELSLGFEYTNLMDSRFHKQRGDGYAPYWYAYPRYDYNTNDGRRYTAHSGTDSDDLLIYFAWLSEKRSIRLSFNYERHGVVYSVELVDQTGSFHYPENKLELNIDYRQPARLGELYLFYEYELTENLGSPASGVFPRGDTPFRKANVYGIGFETQLGRWNLFGDE